jgi:hypothetical protein
VKEESEKLLAKLRLLFERVLVQSLAYLKLLAEEEVDLPLLLSVRNMVPTLTSR